MRKSIGLRHAAAALPVCLLLTGLVAIAPVRAEDAGPAQQESTAPRTQPETSPSIQLAPTVVTATRVEQPSFDLPLAIDSIDKGQIQDAAKPMVNISEQVNRVPGSVVQNRESYAQEQQIILRGFGARSQFGTRGVKLLADGIPASSPDGQGSPGLFDLDSAQRIEVLRGPFSALYGNHSGGVVQIFTEDGPPVPTLSGSFWGGSWESWKAGLKFGGTNGGLNYIGSLSRFETQGYRDHSSAEKDQFNAKLRSDLDGGSSLSLIVNYLNQPDNLDPLGLSATQVAQNPRQAGTGANQFDSRRSLDNLQAGLVYENPLTSADTVRTIVYVGQRNNDGFLALQPGNQIAVKQSGAVSVLNREYWGAGGRWTHKDSLAGAPLTITTGADYDTATEGRKGFLNFTGASTNPMSLGQQGDLKRNEDDSVDSYGSYVQAEWQVLEALSLSGGLRYTRVSFDSEDHFICTNTVNTTGTPVGTCSGAYQANGTPLAVTAAQSTWNPDDSGKQNYSAWTPVIGALYKLTPKLNLYANAGRSFETPTFIELAYRPDGASGLNFNLKPSKSNHYEIGAKAFLTAETRVDIAVFQIDSKDEIVVYNNVGGRSTFQNAGRTQRRGVELGVDSDFGRGFNGYVAATYLDARFKDGFLTCTTTPCAVANVPVNPGNTIPAVPQYSVYGEVSWKHEATGFATAAEARWMGKMWVNDVNSAVADSFTVVNLRAGLEQRRSNWRFSEFARVDNVFSEDYIGAIAVNDANGRFYFPAPTRTFLLGVSASYTF